MNAPAFIADLQSRGALLEADGEKLRVTPATVLTDADRNAWREHKAAILAALESTSRNVPDEPEGERERLAHERGHTRNGYPLCYPPD